MPDDSGSSAIWVAQRVPDDHVTAVANQWVIQEIDDKVGCKQSAEYNLESLLLIFHSLFLIIISNYYFLFLPYIIMNYRPGSC